MKCGRSDKNYLTIAPRSHAHRSTDHEDEARKVSEWFMKNCRRSCVHKYLQATIKGGVEVTELRMYGTMESRIQCPPLLFEKAGTIKFGLMMSVNRFLIIDIQYYFVISEKRNHGKANKYYVPSFFFEKAGNDKI